MCCCPDSVMWTRFKKPAPLSYPAQRRSRRCCVRHIQLNPGEKQLCSAASKQQNEFPQTISSEICPRYPLVYSFSVWIFLTEYTSAALKHKVHLYTFLCIDQCRMYNYCLARHSKFILMNHRQEPYIKDNLLLLFSSTTIYGVFPGYFEILLAKVKAFLFAAGRVSGCSCCWFPCF